MKFTALLKNLFFLVIIFSFMSACSSEPAQVELTMYPPCNETSYSQDIDYVKFEPRGKELDQKGTFSTQYSGSTGKASLTDIPMSDDFYIRVFGYKTSFTLPPVRFGQTSSLQLATQKTQKAHLKAIFATTDGFYQTTNIDLLECTQMVNSRFGHTATYIPSQNKVYIIGGIGGLNVRPDDSSTWQILTSIEVYDVSAGTYEILETTALEFPTAFHTASLINEDKILIVGGITGLLSASNHAYIFDTATLQFTPIALNYARAYHTATTVAESKVAIIGGFAYESGKEVYISNIELFDPLTFQISDTGVSLQQARSHHATTAVSGGVRILVAGGVNQEKTLDSIEVYRVVNNTFALEKTSEVLSSTRMDHGIATIQDHFVFISGGYQNGSVTKGNTALRSIDLLYVDQTNGKVIPICVGNLNLTKERAGHQATLLKDNRVLLTGGYNDANGGQVVSEGEIVTLDYQAGSCSLSNFSLSKNNLLRGRYLHRDVLLGNGQVLITGGADLYTTIDSAEIFNGLPE